MFGKEKREKERDGVLWRNEEKGRLKYGREI